MTKTYRVKITTAAGTQSSIITARSADSADKKAYNMMLKANGSRYIVYRIAA